MSDWGRRLAEQAGEEGAFFMIDRLRNGGEMAPSEQAMVGDIPREALSDVDRYLEGRLSGIGAVPAAAAYEAAKPLIAALPASVQRYLPEGFRHVEGVTSAPSLSHITSTARGAWDAGRIIPWSLTGRSQGPREPAQASASAQAAALRRSG